MLHQELHVLAHSEDTSSKASKSPTSSQNFPTKLLPPEFKALFRLGIGIASGKPGKDVVFTPNSFGDPDLTPREDVRDPRYLFCFLLITSPPLIYNIYSRCQYAELIDTSGNVYQEMIQPLRHYMVLMNRIDFSPDAYW